MLSKLSEHFELIIYTASVEEYADPIVEKIEQGNNYFEHVLSRDDLVV